MLRSGGAVILMQRSLISTEDTAILSKVTFLTGNEQMLASAVDAPACAPFNEKIVAFLGEVSKALREDKQSRLYPDVVTLGFFMRKASLSQLKDRFDIDDGNIRLGRGVAFHIAPSNVPVNFAYSLVAGLVTGNVNIVRVPSKSFPQVDIISKAINNVLEKSEFDEMRKYVFLVRYDRNKEINDIFSRIADTRIIWGGDATIAELRKSPIGPRSTEVTFADRYSLAIIDSDEYLATEDKDRLAESFYNDTYLTDQNACTSPRIIVWTGQSKEQAKSEFYGRLHEIVKKKYVFQPIMGVNKLTSAYILAAKCKEAGAVSIVEHEDNYLVRAKVSSVSADIMDYKDNSGFFFEYDCDDITTLRPLCDNTHCQTIGYLGKKENLMPLLELGIRGVDRVVPIGKTMDFDFIWDGYNLYERLTRTIAITI